MPLYFPTRAKIVCKMLHLQKKQTEKHQRNPQRPKPESYNRFYYGTLVLRLWNYSNQADVHVRELLEKNIESTCGLLIRTEHKLHAEVSGSAAEGSKRKVLLRAIAGGVESKHLWQSCPGGPIKVAQHVFLQAQRLADCSIISRWVQNGGKPTTKKTQYKHRIKKNIVIQKIQHKVFINKNEKRRKRLANKVWQQPIGEAGKRRKKWEY